MRFAREVWVRDHFARLCTQYCVDTAVDLTAVLRPALEERRSSIYIAFSFSYKRPYIGLVEDRDALSRFREHWEKIVQHQRGIAEPWSVKYEKNRVLTAKPSR